jgi:hypothetical protein
MVRVRQYKSTSMTPDHCTGRQRWSKKKSPRSLTGSGASVTLRQPDWGKGMGDLSGWLASNTGTRFAKKCHVHKSACPPLSRPAMIAIASPPRLDVGAGGYSGHGLADFPLTAHGTDREVCAAREWVCGGYRGFWSFMAMVGSRCRKTKRHQRTDNEVGSAITY